MTEDRSALRVESIAVSAGRPAASPDGPLNLPITPASALHAGGDSGYARDGQPPWAALEATIGALEGGHAVVFSSGMAAAQAALTLIGPAARIVAPAVAYMDVRRSLMRQDETGPRSVTFVDVADTQAVLDACEQADALWLESPTNPLLEVADLPRLCTAARERGIFCVVDNTMATPLLQQPLLLGADLVVHSATKAMGGHSDLLLGAVAASAAGSVARLHEARELYGATPGALEVFLCLRGLRTLPLRMQCAQSNAMALAERLVGHRDALEVRYPGLRSHPDHQRAASTMSGFGTLLTVRVAGGAARADAVVDAVELITHATSFGAVESTLERRARYPAERDVPDDLLRISVGCEHVDDLWDDLTRALDAARGASGRPG